MISRVLGGVVAAGASVGGYGWYWATTTMGDDALERLKKYSAVVSPAVMEYKWTEAKCEKLPKMLPLLFPPVPEEEQHRRFQELHEKWAKPIFDVFMELGGFYYKSGQKIASNAGGVWPKLYTDMFQPFLNQIPQRPKEEIRAVVEAELGRPREEVFSEWEDKPIGCASIGQVHRARLKSTGERVVVKVQNPDAERTFKGDVFSIKVLVDVFTPQFSVAFDEIAKQFATEFDYRGECTNAMEIRDNLHKGGFDDKIIVPKVMQELCTQKLMVMEEIYPSTPLHDVLDAQADLLAKQRGISKEQFLDEEQAKLEEESREAAKKGKLIEAVSASDYDKYIKLQKFKRGVVRGLKHTYNYTLGWVLPAYNMAEEDVFVPLNAAKLVDDLLVVHGHEALVDGCFNGDPHPGNVLYANGKLALIDYGQVKRMTEKQRLDTCKCILLVDEAIKTDPRVNPGLPNEVHLRARQALVAHSRRMGMTTKYDKDDTHYEMMTVYLGRMDAAWVYPRNIIQWTDYMQDSDPLENIDAVDHLVLLNMATMMLRGLGEMLRQPRNVASVWAPVAREALQKEGLLEEVDQQIESWYAGYEEYREAAAGDL